MPKTTDRAFELGDEIIETLQRAAHHLNAAVGWARLDAWFSFAGLEELMKYWRIRRAKKELTNFRELLDEFQSCVENLHEHRPLEVEVKLPGELIVADLFDVFMFDWTVLDSLQKAKRKTSIGISRMRVILKAIAKQDDGDRSANE